MSKNFIAYAAAIAMALSAPTAMADNVDLSPAQRAANIKEYNKRKAQGIIETPRGGRGASKKSQQEHVGTTPHRQASEQTRQKCEEASHNAKRR